MPTLRRWWGLCNVCFKQSPSDIERVLNGVNERKETTGATSPVA